MGGMRLVIWALALGAMGGSPVGGDVLAGTPPLRTQEEQNPPGETYKLKLEPRSPLVARSGDRPRWSPKNATLPLEEESEGYRGEIKLGPEGRSTAFRLRKAKGQVIDTLQIDLDGDGKFRRQEVIPGRPGKDSRVSWVFVLQVAFPERKSTLECPCFILYVPSPDPTQKPPVARFGHRGFMQGGGKVRGLGRVEVILVDFNHDGQYTIDEDRWALAPAGERETLYDPASARALQRHNWIQESAFAAHSLTADGRELIITPTETELSREEERIRDDPYHADKQERRSGSSVTFLHDFEKAETLGKKKKRVLLIDFETTWCGPCKKMDELVYTADKIVAAARRYVCVKVDGDERKDLAERFEVKVYPTLVLVDPKGKVLDRRTGYQPVADLQAWLKSTKR